MARLSPRQRVCVVLRYYDDLTVPQIADTLGLAPGTVTGYLADASRALRAVLGGQAVAPTPATGAAAPSASTSATSTEGRAAR